MRTRIHSRIALPALFALLLATSLGLVACSDDTLTSPTDPAPQASLDEQWQTQVDALRAEIGDEAMAELTPQLEQARASLGDTAAKHGARLYLSYATTTFDQAYIYLTGWGTVIGPYTAVATNVVDNSVYPFIQYTTTTHTDQDGDEITFDSVGTGTLNEDGTVTEFSGSAEWTGGTGRYAGATGTLCYTGNANLVEFTGQILYWGWIDLND